MQGLNFLIILIYFVFVGFYLKWFAYPSSVLYSALFFVVIYIVIRIAF